MPGNGYLNILKAALTPALGWSIAMRKQLLSALWKVGLSFPLAL